MYPNKVSSMLNHAWVYSVQCVRIKLRHSWTKKDNVTSVFSLPPFKKLLQVTQNTAYRQRRNFRFHAFLTSELGGARWSAYSFGHFTPAERAHSTHCLVGCGPELVWTPGRRISLIPSGIPRSSNPQPIHYTNWAIPAALETANLFIKRNSNSEP